MKREDDNDSGTDDDEVEASAENQFHSSLSGSKRRRLTDEERIKRCRERNRVHARNTRERKRMQMEQLQSRIQELIDEKQRLKLVIPDASVASILMSLCVASDIDAKQDDSKIESKEDTSINAEKKSEATILLEKLRSQVSALLSDDEEFDSMDPSLFMPKDKSSYTSSELTMIRKERNRMHAKKTRLRKKKMLSEMEAMISNLEEEIKIIRQESSYGIKDIKSVEQVSLDGGSGYASDERNGTNNSDTKANNGTETESTTGSSSTTDDNDQSAKSRGSGSSRNNSSNGSSRNNSSIGSSSDHSHSLSSLSQDPSLYRQSVDINFR
eukprot:gene13968-18736_t